MIAPAGTQLQAVVSGFVEHHSNALGGVTLSLLGDNGNRYYYAHLSAYEGAAGRVEQARSSDTSAIPGMRSAFPICTSRSAPTTASP